ncbi:hypothetical protein [Sanguibacter gelidistatuariae]|uniref:hypothetical protein n=1 Tax=Sanguibacter gelidistatuariae TaxID=1814289 RepID=UPI001113AB0B|nr:hypothetical protein [Sanguibacter gelidistatuariae]
MNWIRASHHALYTSRMSAVACSIVGSLLGVGSTGGSVVAGSGVAGSVVAVADGELDVVAVGVGDAAPPPHAVSINAKVAANATTSNRAHFCPSLTSDHPLPSGSTLTQR